MKTAHIAKRFAKFKQRMRNRNGFGNIYDLLRRFFDSNWSVSNVLFVYGIRKSKRIDDKMRIEKRKSEHKFWGLLGSV